MEITISSRTLNLSDSVKEYISEKFERVSKLSANTLTAEVHINQEKRTYHMHAILRGDWHVINSSAENEDNMYKAIDLCIDKIKKQFRRGKKDYNEQKEAKETERGGALVG